MKCRIVILMFFVVSSTYGQYVPNTGQAFQYASLYNPAFSGIENYGDLKLGYRYQWTRFKENAPKFGNLMFNVRIKEPLDLKVNAPRSSIKNFDNVVPRRKLTVSGLGINLFNESIGPIKRVGGGVNYALHFPVTKTLSFAGGLGIMMENTKLNSDDLYWGQSADLNDPVYQSLASGPSNHSELWLKAGGLLFSDNFFIGVSYYPFSSTLKSSDVMFTDEYYEGSFQAGVSIPLSDGKYIKPSVYGILQTNNALLIDYNVKFYLQDKAWFGLTYRDIKGAIVSAGLNINEKFSAGYSYEFSLGEFQQFNSGSHELVLAMKVNNVKRIQQRTW